MSQPKVQKIVEVRSRILNVRMGPGTSFPVMNRRMRGDELKVVHAHPGPNGRAWYAFLVGYGIGWVYAPLTRHIQTMGGDKFRIEHWPTPFPQRPYNQGFGQRPERYEKFGLPGHEGVDFAVKTGDRIFSVAAGEVYQVNSTGRVFRGGEWVDHPYGLHVRVLHAGDYKTVYAHLSRVDVKKNQVVAAGDVLGLAGSTGNSTGPHLHFTMKNATRSTSSWPYDIVNPTPYLEAWRTRERAL